MAGATFANALVHPYTVPVAWQLASAVDVRARDRPDHVARRRRDAASSTGGGTSVIAFLRSRAGVALLLLTGVAAALRFATIDQQSYWYDEAITASLLDGSLFDVFRGVLDTESTPPLYYVLGWAWAQVVGSDEASLRSLSALAGTLVVPVAFAAGRVVATARIGLAAAALAAVSPMLIWYSQEARAYALLALFGGASFVCFALARSDPSRRQADRMGGRQRARARDALLRGLRRARRGGSPVSRPPTADPTPLVDRRRRDRGDLPAAARRAAGAPPEAGLGRRHRPSRSGDRDASASRHGRAAVLVGGCDRRARDALRLDPRRGRAVPRGRASRETRVGARAVGRDAGAAGCGRGDRRAHRDGDRRRRPHRRRRRLLPRSQRPRSLGAA